MFLKILVYIFVVIFFALPKRTRKSFFGKRYLIGPEANEREFDIKQQSLLL